MRIRFETTKGEFVVQVHPDWAPAGAERFRELTEAGYWKDARFFRVLPGFVVQWGIHGDPAVGGPWRNRRIPDDPVKESNTRGRVTFAAAGPDTRTTQVFINYGDNSRLDGMGFAPFGEVVEGMDVVDGLESRYGEQASQAQGRIQDRGNAFLDEKFPGLDAIISATIEE